MEGSHESPASWPIGGRAPMSDRVAVTRSCPVLGSQTSRWCPSYWTGACPDCSQHDEYMRFFKELNGLDLVNNMSHLPLTEVGLFWNYGKGDLVSGQHLRSVFPEPLPDKDSLSKESLNWGVHAQFGVMDWSAVLSLVGLPLLGAVTNSITWTSGSQENCRRAVSTSSTWKWM